MCRLLKDVFLEGVILNEQTVKKQVDKEFKLCLQHDTRKNKKEMVFHQLLLTIPHLGIYLRYCGEI